MNIAVPVDPVRKGGNGGNGRHVFAKRLQAAKIATVTLGVITYYFSARSRRKLVLRRFKRPLNHPPGAAVFLGNLVPLVLFLPDGERISCGQSGDDRRV